MYKGIRMRLLLSLVALVVSNSLIAGPHLKARNPHSKQTRRPHVQSHQPKVKFQGPAELSVKNMGQPRRLLCQKEQLALIATAKRAVQGTRAQGYRIR